MKSTVLITLCFHIILAAHVETLMCPENQTMNCTSEDSFVCSITVKDGKQIKETLHNWCKACSTSPDFYVTGECEQYPIEAQFCSPQSKKTKRCTREYIEHCGWFTPNDIIGINAPNKCTACALEDVTYVTEGACPY